MTERHALRIQRLELRIRTQKLAARNRRLGQRSCLDNAKERIWNLFAERRAETRDM